MAEGEPAERRPSLTGSVLGRYVLERLLGEGGMGAVYAARHQDLGKAGAVKVLHERFDQSEVVRQRFLREGQAASRIRHPNIVDVYDVGADAGRAYLVMELLEGEDLGSLLAREGALSPQRVADLFVPVLSALAAAHDAGIVHRDLKPDNIFLSSERTSITPKVLDFGISKVNEEGASLTGTGTLLGTPCYMSPEQAQTEKNVDSRSDQYSVGVVLYECVAGRKPIEEASLYRVIHRIVQGDFPSPRQLEPSIPAAFEQLILRAMARNPAERFSSTRALGRALLPFASERIRANHAEEFANDGGAPASLVSASSSNRQAIALGTTLSESVHERDAGKTRPSRLSVARVGIAAAVVLGALGIWLGSKSDAPAGPATAPPAPSAPPKSSASLAPTPPAVPVPSSPEPEDKKQLRSEPMGADVWIAGKAVGQTPLSVELTSGAPLEVELRKPGFEPKKALITSADAEVTTVQLVQSRTRSPAGKTQPRATDRPELAPR